MPESFAADHWQTPAEPTRLDPMWTVRLALSNPDDDAAPWAQRVVAELADRSAAAATLPGWIEVTVSVAAPDVWSVPPAVAAIRVVEAMGTSGWTVDWLEVLSSAAYEAELHV